jgi:predicted RNA-binding Zn-ribbon protein involved in translation (DUF1610 family)
VDVFLVIAASIIIGLLLGVTTILSRLTKKYTLYKKDSVTSVAIDQYRDHSLLIKKLNVDRASAKCKSCDTEIVADRRHPFVSCRCGEIFVSSSATHMTIGAKDFDNLHDTSTVSITDFLVKK